ncbi:putative chorismate pyruvate-lyase [Chitiniphilus shinanonensis]|uniref:Probable chorismate pyruvate-lyase n=1 Tax=Chitiniphilus shinanonensis TaxID=553088 RepID=A0ABQ6BVP1_9NEIS|nr:chorismate lyase [Chitiniphilus shinanonensis]GLS05517.1 putative chorismate pyruvate-lyase [Chitiniphilus shinanonensis]
MPHQHRWHHPLCLAPRPLRPWLTESGSLTARLIAHHPRFRVRVLAQGMARPHDDECATLRLPRRKLLAPCREVLLCSGDTPLVFAHSVTTPAAVRRGFRKFRHVGGRSLGSMLFASPTIARSALAWRRVDARHPLWREARAAVGPLPPRLWARRSVFYAGRDRLLVTEVFLPPHFTEPR